MSIASFFGSLSSDLAIDLGSANTLMYVKGRGVVCNEPTVVAVENDSSTGKRRVTAVGADAKGMIGRTPDSITAIRPVREGVIADYEVAQEMLRNLIKKHVQRHALIRPRVIIAVPHGVTEVEKRAVKSAVLAAGAREVHLIEEPMAAAIGAGLPITEPCGSMILDIGGGTTEIAIISMRGVVFSRSLRVAGDKMDEAIVQYIKRRYNVLIGDRTAEQVKIAIGAALPTGESLAMEVRGRDLVQGVPKAVTVTEDDVREALTESITQIVEVTKVALEKTPPELASDIVERGIALSGGGALLRHLDRVISRETGLPVVLVQDPMTSVVMGSGMVLDQFELLRDILLQ